MRLAEGPTPASNPLKNAARVHCHLGSGSWPARVYFCEPRVLSPGDRAIAQLRFESSCFAFIGDRFVLRDPSERWTLAGGQILETSTRARGFRRLEHRRTIQQRADRPESVDIYIRSILEKTSAVKREGLLCQSRFSESEIMFAVNQLSEQKLILTINSWLVDSTWWETCCRDAAGIVDREHELHPEHQGLTLAALRRAMKSRLPARELFDPLTVELDRRGYHKSAGVLRNDSHRPSLPADLQRAGAALRLALRQKPWEPPSRGQLAPDSLTQKALQFLIETGEVVELNSQVVLLSASCTAIQKLVVEYLTTHGEATISQLRKTANVSRRIMVPFLERLDREGITRRDQDQRKLR